MSFAAWIVVVLSLATGAGCQRANPSANDAADAAVQHDGNRIHVAPEAPLRKALLVTSVEVRSIERPVVVPAVIEADPARLVKIVPPVSGRIVSLDRHLGDPVKAGDVLFTLDSPELAQAVADAAKAQAALTLARRALNRQHELISAEIAARKDLEQAESDYAQATSDAERAQARLDQLGIRPHEHPVGRRYTLHAPIDGQVIELTAAQGGFWNDTNAPIMTVADLSSVWVAASVQEKDLQAIAVGDDATITLNAYPGEKIHGRIAYLGGVLDSDTRTVKARIALDNSGGRYRPGMFASVTFHAQPHEAPVVPTTALVQSGFDTQVYVQVSPGLFERRVVTLGARLEDATEVLTGLSGGEQIVARNGLLLND